MIKKGKKNDPIIGRQVKPLVDLKNKGGVCIAKGEICTIFQSFRGYGIKTPDNRIITRVWKGDITDVL